MVDIVDLQAPRSSTLAPDFRHFLEFSMNLASLYRIPYLACLLRVTGSTTKEELAGGTYMKQIKQKMKIVEELEQENFNEMSLRQCIGKWNNAKKNNF